MQGSVHKNVLHRVCAHVQAGGGQGEERNNNEVRVELLNYIHDLKTKPAVKVLRRPCDFEVCVHIDCHCNYVQLVNARCARAPL